jgi:hypothetical protein
MTSITQENVGVIVDKLESGFIEFGRRVVLCNRKPNSVGKSLSERTSGNFNAWGIMGFWVTWGNAIDML